MNKSNMVRDYFDKIPKEFDSLYNLEEMHPIMRKINTTFRNGIYRRIDMTLDHIAKHDVKSVLDVGCGSGRFSISLAQMGIKTVGIDFSPAMIEFAKDLAARKIDKNHSLEFLCVDLSSYKTDLAFDLITALGFFDYIHEPKQLLKRMKQLTKKGAWIVGSFPKFTPIRGTQRKIRYLISRCPLRFFNQDELESFAKELEFDDVEIIPYGGGYYVKYKV